MFSKILKHDLKSIGRFWWIIAVSTLGISVLGSLAFRFMLEIGTSNVNSAILVSLATIFSALFSMLSIFGIAASMLLTQILVYLRFYKHFFTDEGYLTFTLPVSRRQLLFSKTLNAFIWLCAHTVLMVICVLIFVTIAAPTLGESMINTNVLTAIPNAFKAVWNVTGAWTIVYTVELLLILLLGILFSINLAHMCITIGAVVAKKMKLLAAIGIYYGVNVVLSSILPTLFYASLFSFAEGLAETLANAPEQVIFAVIALIALIICLIIAATVFVLYSITLDKLERRLNLA